MRAHANVAGDGGCGCCPDDDADGTEAFGRILATGKHGLAFFFGLLLCGGGGVASSASVATDSSDNDTRGGRGGLWRRRHVDDSVSVVDADEQEKLL